MVLRLIVENDRNEFVTHDFEGSYIAAGRSSNSDLVLDERNISRHHFQLEIIDNRIIIEDRGSYNKTFVNDREITEKMEIFVGDIISIGDFNIYLDQGTESMLKTATATTESSAKIAPENLLLAKSGYIGGKVFFLEGIETVIGSHVSADIYLYNPDIPPVHSKIIFDGNIHLLVKGDPKGKYPLIVDEMEISYSIDMRHGDEVKVGDFVFEFIEKGAEYDPKPYLIIAEETRKEKLRKDIAGNKIKSVRDEEVTEITQVKKMGSKWVFYTIVGIGVATVVAAIVAAVIVFSKKNSEDLGFKNHKIELVQKVKEVGKASVA
ncbi:MAG: FHA domain-containing protein [bacterium]